MNILGHPYVAFKVTGRINPYLVAGSHLPDLVPFVPKSVFTFEEIHESPDKFLKFLDKRYPYVCARDLALGMMSHSVKFGADKFNREIEEWLLGNSEAFKDKLARKIVDCSGISFETARKYRLHNYLWGGIDLFLLQQKPNFIKNLTIAYRQIDNDEVACLLAESFKKDRKEVKRMVDYLLSPMEQSSLVNLEGLVEIWKKALAGLPKKDKVDEEKTAKLFQGIYRQFEDQWEEILTRVIGDVKRRMNSFV